MADQAGVGKGTVYLHWKTREALFQSVFRRELAAAADDLVTTMREDPHAMLLHRLTRANFLGVIRRPLLRALVLGDPDVLGKLAMQRREMRHQGALFMASVLRDDVERAADLLATTVRTARARPSPPPHPSGRRRNGPARSTCWRAWPRPGQRGRGCRAPGWG